MPAGRPHKPTQILEISGAFAKNPARRRARANEPKIKAGLGDPPAEWVSGAETNGRLAGLLRAWQNIVAQDLCHVLNASHRILVEATCYLMYKIRRANEGYGKATSGDHSQVVANLAKEQGTMITASTIRTVSNLSAVELLRREPVH